MTPSTATIGLIGLGNIGFRHLQGLLPVRDRIVLHGVDPDPGCVERAAAEWTRQGGEGRFSTSLEDIGDIAIGVLATPSRGRLALIEAVLAKARPDLLILEKVVFTRAADFAAAAALAGRVSARFAVNCPRRLWPLYRRLRELIGPGDAPVRIELSNPHLGLACNGVHFVDLLQFLSGQAEVAVLDAAIDEVAAAKRAGYFEAFGEVRFETPRGDRLTLVVRSAAPQGQLMSVACGARAFAVREADGVIAEEGSLAEVGRPPYQSELTGKVVADFLDGGRCELASLAESAQAHAALIGAIEPAFARFGVDCSHGLPIT